jgi:hypothetical protein
MDSNKLNLEKCEDIEAADENFLDSVDNIDSQMSINCRIGFFESGIKKKEVKQALVTMALDTFSTLKGVYYRIRKYNGGFAYEIHHGSDKGILLEVLDKVENDDLLFRTNDANYKISLKSNGHLTTLKLRNNDPNILNFTAVKGKDKLLPVESKGYGFFAFGSVFLLAGFLGITISSIAKYVIIDKKELITYPLKSEINPESNLSDAKRTIRKMNDKNEYLVYIMYDKDKKIWDNKVGKVEPPPTLPASPVDSELKDVESSNSGKNLDSSESKFIIDEQLPPQRPVKSLSNQKTDQRRDRLRNVGKN